MTLQERLQEYLCSGAQSPQEGIGLLLEVVSGVISTSGNTFYLANGQSFQIPPYSSQHFTYYGSTNNIQTQTFKDSDDNDVAVLTYTYVNDGLSDDDLIESITRTT